MAGLSIGGAAGLGNPIGIQNLATGQGGMLAGLGGGNYNNASSSGTITDYGPRIPGLGYQGSGTTGTTDTTGGTTGGTTASALANPGQSSQIAQLNNLVNAISSQYDTLFNNYNQGVATQRQAIDSSSANQQAQLNDQFSQAAPQLGYMNAARGLSDSSYARTAQDNAANSFNDQTSGINIARDKDINNLSAQAASDLAGYRNNQQTLRDYQTLAQQLPNDATSAYQLRSMMDQAYNYRGDVAKALGSAQNPTQLQQYINSNAPSQVYNPAQLSNLLSNLGQSSIPGFAKTAISQGATTANAPGSAINPQQQRFS
jgi:hypothetical protein